MVVKVKITCREEMKSSEDLINVLNRVSFRNVGQVFAYLLKLDSALCKRPILDLESELSHCHSWAISAGLQRHDTFTLSLFEV